MTKQIGYDDVATMFDQGYTVDPLAGVTRTLREMAKRVRAQNVLEVGCGTGRWLSELKELVPDRYGLDISAAMLRQSKKQSGGGKLAQARASQMPYPYRGFDMVYCINSLHLFPEPQEFINEARRLLRLGGLLVIIGMDPRHHDNEWFVYDYFKGTHERDLQRFPEWGDVWHWLRDENFQGLEWRVIEQANGTVQGRAVLHNTFLNQQSTSVMAALSEREYKAGYRRVADAIYQAEQQGKKAHFPMNIVFTMVSGYILE